MSLFIWIVVIVGLVALIVWSKKIKAAQREEKKRKLIAEAQAYLDSIKKNKSFPRITTSTFLENNETAFLQEKTKLLETRAVRRSSGGFGSVRIMKGVSIGKYSGTSESTQEWRVLDSGDLLITSKKIVFMGNKENRNLPLSKILAVEPSMDSIELTLESKNKSIIFTVQNPYIWAATISVLRQIKDPLNLGGVNLNIDLA